MSDAAVSGKAPSTHTGRKARRYYLVALSAFLVGVTFSLAIWHNARLALLNTEKTRFDHYAGMINSMIRDQLGDQISAAYSLRAFYNSSDRVTRGEWRLFVSDLEMQRHYYGALGFAFTRYVRRSDLAAFLAATRADGAPDFRVTTTGEHPDLYVVEFIEPLEANRAILGYDYATEPVRRIAFIDAVQQDRVALSGRVALMQSPDEGPGFLLVLPVYTRGAVLASAKQRWRALQGWVTVPIRIDALLADVLEHLDTPLDIEIFDGSPDAIDFLLYDHDGELHTLARDHEHPLPESTLHSHVSLKVADRTWYLNIIALDGFSKTLEGSMPAALLGAGLLLSCLAALLIGTYGRHLDEAQVLTEKITADLRRTEQRFQNLFRDHDAVMLQISTQDGAILDANKAACRFYGYPLGQLIGKSIEAINLLPSVQVAAAMQQVSTGRRRSYEFRHRLASGEIRDVEVHSSPIEISNQTVLFSIIHDITPRKQAELSLRESEARFRTVFETNPDPVILASFAEGEIFDVNQAFETVTGIARSDAQGQWLEDLELWIEAKNHESFLVRLHRLGEVNNFEIDFLDREGTQRTGLLSARSLQVNRLDCALISIRDITLEKAAERTLVQVSQMKSEFISTAAHELRTPLSAIMGFTELLLTPREFGKFTRAQKKEFLREVYNRGNALARLIDDLLDISRIESGRPISLNLQEVDVPEMLERTLEFFRLHDKFHTYRLECPRQGIDATCLLDRQRISQVLENLLGNAGKFSPRGSEIVVSANAGESRWEIVVVDRGIGMTEEQIEKVFDKFYRADSSNTGSSGLGLGMSIVKQIIEVHNGRIQVESAPGAGTRVTFTLPRTPGAQTS